MANNEDVNQANQGAPAADIPDLKKKEKERKKAGAGWGGAKPGGGSFSGATGGAGSSAARAAASAASSMGGAAGGVAAGAAAGAAEAVGGGWLSAMIASLMATVLGKAILAAGVAMFLAGAALFGYALLKGDGAAGAGGLGGDLGAIASSMRIRGGGDDRMGVASNGEIMFDPLKAAAEAKKPEAVPEDKTAGDKETLLNQLPNQLADAAQKGSAFNRPSLEYNLSGAKLSSSLGGGFGGKNIFSGGSSAPKLNEALSKVNIPGGKKGSLSGSRKTTTGRTTAGGKASNMKANKAFGQLKVAKGMSTSGAATSEAEGARSSAANAFDGGPKAGVGNVIGSPSGTTTPGGVVTSPSSPGGGAPDVTAPTVTAPYGSAMDPNTASALAGIAALAKAAGEMKKTAAMLMMMGLALIVIGAILVAMGNTPLTFYLAVIGAIIIGIGGMLIGMSIMMSQMAEMMKGMADTMSEGLAARTTDVRQDKINKYCIDKAYNEGTDPKNCNPPDSVTTNAQTKEKDEKAVKEHKNMVKETGRVEGLNGKPTGQ